jgi:alkylation response protein AidB-like acyl-CoA dehydrogenase
VTVPATETTTTTSKEAKPRKPLPAPNSDFYDVRSTLSTEEQDILKQVREFAETKVTPIIGKYWLEDAFPFELLPAFKELNIGGISIKGYGGRGKSLALLGFIQMELARVDPSISTFFGVHAGLAMGSIYLGGSEEQKQKWLPPMISLEKIGCFGLTEPLVGSGTSAGMTTTAKREGDTWVLNGEKKWIGNSPWCDISIIWARDLADNQVKAFIVENKTTPGFSVVTITDQMALMITRYAVAWMATGCQMGAYEHALKYAQERLQFGKPIASFQMIQDLLARMISNITACQCMVTRMAQMYDEGKLTDPHASVAKAFCTAKCRETVAWAREICGGNGISVDYGVGRYFADAEALYTYEGTYQMQNLIIGKAVSGLSAFV